MSTNYATGGGDALCGCGMRGLHACGHWPTRPWPAPPTVYTYPATYTYADPRVPALEARIAELEAAIERLTKRRPKPSKDAG